MIIYTNRVITISLVLLQLYFDDCSAADPGDVDKYLQTGTKLLAAGQLMDALGQYDKAVESDPKNYLIYYRRATVYLAMGKTKSAIEDLSSCLELNDDFTHARSQRAQLYLKQGRAEETKLDINKILKKLPDNEEAMKLLASHDKLVETIENAESFIENNNYAHAIAYLDVAIEVAPMNHDLREMRAKCYIKMGDKKKAIPDLRQMVRLSNDDREGILKLSKELYEIGDAEQSLVEIRECLRLDPDHKECFQHYKFVKKLSKLINLIQESSRESKYDECISKAEKLKKSDKNYEGIATQFLCTCHTKGGDANSALTFCKSATEFEPNNMDILCDLADAYISNEDYESAIKQFQNVLDIDRDHKRAKEGVKKGQKLLKNAKKRNYYKVLGVSRTASKREILKAYRKLAAEYHPDSYKGDNKKAAEKKFLDITDAKDVLTDPEKRQKFDNGEDPLDPEQQFQGPTGGPFGGFTFHNFNPFENGGFQYEFHFG